MFVPTKGQSYKNMECYSHQNIRLHPFRVEKKMKRNLSYDIVFYKVLITKTKTMLPIFLSWCWKKTYTKRFWINAQVKKIFHHRPCLGVEIKTIDYCIIASYLLAHNNCRELVLTSRTKILVLCFSLLEEKYQKYNFFSYCSEWFVKYNYKY